MIKFTFSGDFTEEQIEDFAKVNRWNEDSDVSASDYVKEVLKKKILWMIGAPTRDKIKKEFDAKQKEALNLYEDELRQSISVESATIDPDNPKTPPTKE